MTTHDQQTDLDHSTEIEGLATEPVIETHDHSLQQSDYQESGYQAPSEPGPAGAEPSTEAAPSTEKPATEKALFADHELSELQGRWADVQASFVDDPKDCVRQADGLVSDIVDQIIANFSQARSHLEEQWARGEDASTEDLRVALKRYREFFQRLLTV